MPAKADLMISMIIEIASNIEILRYDFVLLKALLFQLSDMTTFSLIAYSRDAIRKYCYLSYF